jgi:hypothetical protein
LSTEETTTSTTTLTKEPDKKKQPDQELDLIDLNPEDTALTDEGSLKQEGEEDFDPEDYGGFPIEAWQKYIGAINDKRQARRASLAKISSYTVRMDQSTVGSPYPDFKYVSLKYSPITKSAWELRRKEIAEIEDMEREVNMQNTRIAEMQESLRLRIFSRNKPRGMVTNRDDATQAQLEEIQNNMRFYQQISLDISSRLAEKRQASDLKAFRVYFHKDEDVYKRLMNEDVDDILGACDWKQIYGSANLRLSKPSSLPAPSPGTQ